MVIGLLAMTAIPTVTGVSLGVSEQRKQNERVDDERRMAKFHIEAYAKQSSDTSDEGEAGDEAEINGKYIVLKNDKVPFPLFPVVTVHFEPDTNNQPKTYLDDPSQTLHPNSHKAEAFYISYPEPEHTKHLKRGLGLVTTISSDPPMLNWIYADKDTHELKYGNRSQSVEHVVGPWDWRDEETVVTLEKTTGFVAVEEEDGAWAVYFDRDGDGLAKRGIEGRKRIGIGLRRRIIEQEGKGGDGNGEQGNS